MVSVNNFYSFGLEEDSSIVIFVVLKGKIFVIGLQFKKSNLKNVPIQIVKKNIRFFLKRSSVHVLLIQMPEGLSGSYMFYAFMSVTM